MAMKATFGGGCFWGMEKWFTKEFGKALTSVSVGYMGGKMENPAYEDVCSGETGHAEVVHMEYDPTKVNYEKLVEFFYRIHDASTPNRQGNDRGTQYRSVIFVHTDSQERIAKEVTENIQQTRYKSKTIVTEIVPASNFYPAEAFHQKYLEHNPGGYCNHRLYW